MTVIITLKGNCVPLGFKNVYKIQEDCNDYKIWFNGEWNTPRSFPKFTTVSLQVDING